MRRFHFSHITHRQKILAVKAGIAVCTLLLIVSFGQYVYKTSFAKDDKVTYKTQEEKDVYVRFVMEVHDSIKDNYWAKTKEENMAQFFQLTVQKATNQQTLPVLQGNDRASIAKMVSEARAPLTRKKKKKEMVVAITNIAMYNLEPAGRNALLSQKQEKALRENVSNINKEKDLYQDLGVEKGASPQVVEQAYKEKEVVLAKSTAPEAKEELKKITYAKKVLTDEYQKKMYDEKQIEPTVFGKVIGSTLYIAISKISPTTLQEFGVIVERSATNLRLDSMIIDLRGNLGGALDFVQYFFGAIMGQHQFVYDLFHQEEYQAQRTTIPKYEPLMRYKEIAVFTDGMTQSTAEVTASVFKRLRLGTVIGEKTRGWGTVENTFPLTTEIDPEEKYALLLVHSLTLRDDNVPIEGKGVDPHVDIRSETFKKDLRGYIRNTSLLNAVEAEIKNTPLR